MRLLSHCDSVQVWKVFVQQRPAQEVPDNVSMRTLTDDRAWFNSVSKTYIQQVSNRSDHAAQHLRERRPLNGYFKSILILHALTCVQLVPVSIYAHRCLYRPEDYFKIGLDAKQRKGDLQQPARHHGHHIIPG